MAQGILYSHGMKQKAYTPLDRVHPSHEPMPLLAQGLFCYSTSCALVDDCTLPQLFGCVKYFLKLF